MGTYLGVGACLGHYGMTSINNKIEVGMAVPKSTQTKFVGITYHIHYTL